MTAGDHTTTEIRRFRTGIDDPDALVRLLHAAFGSYDPPIDPPSSALREDRASVARRLETETCLWIVDADGSAAAGVFLATDGDGAHLSRLAVRPDRQGRGLARRLLAAVEAEARARGCVRLTLGVRLALEGNRRLFATSGFVEIARAAHAGHDRPTTATMAKRLD